jgi:hypothetical protein
MKTNVVTLMSLRATKGRGNLAVLACTIAGLLLASLPRNDTLLNAFAIAQQRGAGRSEVGRARVAATLDGQSQ